MSETTAIKTPLKAMRAKCLDCCCGSAQEVSLCTIPDCPLYPYRFGKSPARQPRQLTEEQREQLRKRLKDNLKKSTETDSSRL